MATENALVFMGFFWELTPVAPEPAILPGWTK